MKEKLYTKTTGKFCSDTYRKVRIGDSFIQLRELKATINQSANQPYMAEFSMGMSGDYEIAVEEGSTMIRLGMALFGT